MMTRNEAADSVKGWCSAQREEVCEKVWEEYGEWKWLKRGIYIYIYIEREREREREREII
jgi:hypothetical protein